MLTLRPYQTQALDAIEAADREGTRRPLVVHPTGTGKGVVMAALAKARAARGRSLVLVHREELATQFAEKLGWLAPELSTGVVKAERDETDAAVAVASVQTASRDARLARLIESDRRSPFGTLIVDEAHHAPAPTWTKVLSAFGSFSPVGPLTVGFTATPERDGKTLGVWESVVSYMSIREAIYGGYLVPILPAVVVETTMDMAKVRRTGGDYSDGDLGTELETSGAIDQIADAYVEHAKDRKGVAFTPTVKTAHHLAEALRSRGIAAEALDGTTPDDVRAAILARLKSGVTQVVCNCGVLTEGFDEPSISCVVVARPTSFHGLYVQMVGRGTRLSPGKMNLLVIDVVGATKRHDLISVVDLGLDEDGPRKKRDKDGERQACPACGIQECQDPAHRCVLCHRYLPARLLGEGATRHENCDAGKAGKVNVFGESRLTWLPVGPGWCLSTGQDLVVMVPAGSDTWKLINYAGTRIETLHEQLPVDWAMGIGEDRAKAFQKLVERGASWRRAPVRTTQIARLISDGFPEGKIHLIKTRGEASDLITRIKGRKVMRRLGVSA